MLTYWGLPVARIDHQYPTAYRRTVTTTNAAALERLSCPSKLPQPDNDN